MSERYEDLKSAFSRLNSVQLSEDRAQKMQAVIQQHMPTTMDARHRKLRKQRNRGFSMQMVGAGAAILIIGGSLFALHQGPFNTHVGGGRSHPSPSVSSNYKITTESTLNSTTKVLSPNGVQSIHASMDIGELVYEPSPSGKIEVIMSHGYGIKSEDLQFNVTRSGGDVRIHLTRKANAAMSDQTDSDVSVEVAVPKEMYQVVLTSNIGAIDVHNTGAAFLNAQVNTGSVSVKDFSGKLQANVNSGRIDVTHVHGNISAECQAGMVNVTQDTIENNVTAVAHTGVVKIQSTQYPKNMTFDVHTGTGLLTVDIPNAKYTKQDSQTAVGSIGRGGPHLEANCDTGTVTVSR